MRERALTRGAYRVVRLASSEQCVSLFLVFLRPLPVQWVECYFDGVAFRGFLRIPRILTELCSEKFEWFDPSPIEPFNLDGDEAAEEGVAEDEERALRRRDLDARRVAGAAEIHGSSGHCWRASTARWAVQEAVFGCCLGCR